MDSQNILFDYEAKEKLKKGINIASDLISISIGPKGRNVGISSWALSKITNSGETILEDLEVKDKFENMGIYFVKELFSKMKNNFLDGSKTAIIIFASIVNGSLKKISSNTTFDNIKNSLDLFLKKLLSELDNLSIEINKNDIFDIAFFSSNDLDVANNLKKAIDLAEDISLISVQTNNKAAIEIEKKDGLEIERGFLLPSFCNNQKMQIELENAKILITDKKIKSFHEILNIIKMTKEQSFPLLIIADDFDKDTIATLLMNKTKNDLNIAAIKTPPYGEKRRDILEDIAYLTGGKFISEDKGFFLNEACFEDLGHADKIIISKDSTFIIGGAGIELDKRILEIEKNYELEKDEIDKNFLKKRILKLKGGITNIKVGSFSEIETKYKKKLFEKILFSVKKSLESKALPAGGFGLLKALDNLKNKIEPNERLGFEILLKACYMPTSMIIKNAGFEDSLIDEILSKPYGFGFNVNSEEIENFLDKKMLDPLETIKNILINAVKMSNIVISSEVLIADE